LTDRIAVSLRGFAVPEAKVRFWRMFADAAAA
jgi:hypothetical protein